jgi:transposase
MKYYPKLSAVCDTQSHLFLSAVIDRGPMWDHVEFRQAVLEAFELQPFGHLVADAGYDAERNHGFVRYRLGATTTIRPCRTGPRSQGKPGSYREEMINRFDKAAYAQRWQIESAFSQCKRRLGSALRARHVFSQHAEIRLRLLTHNLALVRSAA